MKYKNVSDESKGNSNDQNEERKKTMSFWDSMENNSRKDKTYQRTRLL